MPVQFKFDFDKVKEGLLFFAHKKVPGLSKGKVCKLFFLADKLHLVRFGRPVTGDTYYALEHGPVPTNVKDIFDIFDSTQSDDRSRELGNLFDLDRRFTYHQLIPKIEFAQESLSDSDIAALEQTIHRYGDMNFLQLRAVTHETIAYRKAWEADSRHENRAIMSFEDFFEEDEEAVEGAYEEMIENGELSDAFPEPASI